MLIKFFFSILIVFFANVSCAVNWQELGKDSNGNTYYVDVDSITTEDDVIYYKNLIDFPRQNKTGSHSHVSQYEVDCSSEKQIWLNYSFYSRSMAEGIEITKEVPVWNHYGSTLNEIRNITPGSIEYKYK